MLTRNEIAARAAQELKEGDVVNLGIGMPTIVPNYIKEHCNIMFQSENGILGMGNFPYNGKEDPDLINAGKQTITSVDGASFFSSVDAFGMIRGGHIDIAILGAMQVSEKGDIANWMIPGKTIKGMGGAMDLVTGAKKIIVMMEHFSKDNSPKLLPKCNLPLTGFECVNTVITNLGVFKIKNKVGFHLIEIAENTTIEEIRKKTGTTFSISKNLKLIKI